MKPNRSRSILWVPFVMACVCGCHSGSSDAYPTWITEPKGYSPQKDSANAFDAYALAALDAESKGGVNLARVSFYPGQKKEAAAAISEATALVLAATKKPCSFEFVPHKPFQPVPFQSGWRLIGRTILWTVEDGCQAADYDKAISAAIAGTKFGFDLTGGGATDASLGFAIADDIRKAIAPYLIKMSPTQLDRLAKGMKIDLDAKVLIATAIKHEYGNSLQAIQFLQDSLRDDKLKPIQDNLGPDVNEAIRYLQPLAGNARKRKDYFDSLVKAADIEFTEVEHDSTIATVSRPKPNTKIDAPWKKLAKHLYGGARPLLELNDATVARTRLLILVAQIDRLGIRNKAYPTNLKSFTPALIVDPYSGAPFIYHADQAEYSIYSVGANGQDDGGDTDSSFTKPDLKLECSSP